MKQTEERKIYVVVAGTIQVPMNPDSHKPPLRTVVQPAGRQIAQACHVVSKLRHNKMELVSEVYGEAMIPKFEPITTIILQARDSAEMVHVYLLWTRGALRRSCFLITIRSTGQEIGLRPSQY